MFVVDTTLRKVITRQEYMYASLDNHLGQCILQTGKYAACIFLYFLALSMQFNVLII